MKGSIYHCCYDHVKSGPRVQSELTRWWCIRKLTRKISLAIDTAIICSQFLDIPMITTTTIHPTYDKQPNIRHTYISILLGDVDIQPYNCQ